MAIVLKQLGINKLSRTSDTVADAYIQKQTLPFHHCGPTFGGLL